MKVLLWFVSVAAAFLLSSPVAAEDHPATDLAKK